jgi:hypothetical protein
MSAPSTLTRTRERIASAPAWQTFLIVFVPILGLYLVTMSRTNAGSNFDVVAAALPAWQYSQFGDIDLSRFEGLAWIIEVNGRITSNRPPGISFVSVPMFWLFGDQQFTGASPSLLPATATAALLSAGAVGTLHLILRRVAGAVAAVTAALVFGVGTSTWSISANELWPHGPGQFFLALAVLGLASSHYLAGGIAYGAALLIRPVTAVMAAVSGVALGWKRRSWRPVVMVAIGASSGLALLLAYNHALYDRWSVAPPGYGSVFLDRAGTQSPLAYLGDIAGMLFHPKYSIFVFSPFLLFTIPGLLRGWRQAPDWVRAAALAGLVYLLVHLRLNRYWAGAEFNYRYPLEPLIVAAPLLFLSWQTWWETASPGWRRLFWYSVVLSAVAQAVSITVEFTNPQLL